MSSEKPSFETRLSHRTASALYMPIHCARRNCRRTGRCQGVVSATFEPECVAPLPATQRRTFAACISIIHDFARLIQSGGKPVADRDSQTAYIQHFCLTIALGAFAELPKNRRELRRYIRRISYRPLGPSPRGMHIADGYFGHVAEDRHAPATGTAREPTAGPDAAAAPIAAIPGP
jgi:hypothetical protein